MILQLSKFLVAPIISVLLISGCANTNEKEIKANPSTSPIPAEPTSLEDLVINFEAAPYWAWKKSSIKILNSPAVAKTAAVEVGPNSIPDYNSPQIAIDLTSKLYSDFKQDQDLLFIYYGYQDRDWAQSKLNNYLGKNIQEWQKKQAEKSCRAASDCFGGVAITHSTKASAIVLVTASEAGKKDVNHTSGTLESHEYTHIIQDDLQGKFLGQIPRWHAEGEAEFAQAAAIYHLDFATYNVERQRIIKALIKNPEIDKNWLIDFISPASGLVKWQAWDKYDGWRVYDIGMLVTEILTSLKGPESTMRLSFEVGNGLTYQKAFEKIYGISWKQAVPLIAEIIYAQINA